jgi:sugar phosphate isomerase/epimerase
LKVPLAGFPKCYLSELCQTKTMTVEEWIDMSSALDIDGHEFYWLFTPDTKSDRRDLLARVKDQGRSIPMMCYSPDFTRPDRADRMAEVEAQKRALDACEDLGVKFCRVLSGQRRPGLEVHETVSWVAECIQLLLPHAAALGITLVLENHYKDGFWDYPEFAQSMDVFMRLLEAVGDHSNFGVNYDPSNALVAGDDPLVLLEAVKHRVVSMHASDRYLKGGTLDDLKKLDASASSRGYASILQHGVIGQGFNDYDRIFALLKSVGFTGWVSIEDGSDPQGGMERLQQSAVFLREKMHQYGLP